MHYKTVRILNLKNRTDCDNAIINIESNYNNYIGGSVDWYNGVRSYLLAAASKKIDSINKRKEKMS
jgi:hypothetical protein|tara:strand:- start:1192 stop:1389 length:198 start_codon:yes stop_codon:yes gene_type:complete